MAEQTREKEIKKYRAYDYSLLFLTIFLVCFGLVMIYSTSSYHATKYYNDPTLFLRKQGIFALMGIPVMIVISKIDYHFYIRKFPVLRIRPIYLFYLLCVALQVLVIILGDEIKGAKRWLEIPGIGSFQPSELTKICVILLTAYIAYIAPKRLDTIWGFFRVLVYAAPLLGLVAAENLSTAIILCGIFVVICFVTSRKKGYFIICGILFVGAVAAFILLGESFRGERIDAWINVETHPKGYQTLQGLYAIASGGVWGKGLGESVQKLGFIPESHNDMIFSVICEELGLFGAIAVILLFVLLLWRLFVVAVNAPDLYGSLISVGVMTHIALQVLINIAVVTNSIPATGIPLPFVSYGGTSLMVLLMEMGIVLGVSGQIEHTV